MARETAGLGPAVEIGSYCGRSTVYLGMACKAEGQVLFAVDHHRGSEENQPGWEHHDSDLWDAEAGSLDTLPSFRRTLRSAALEETVIAVVGHSAVFGRAYQGGLGMVFIDGGHGEAPAYDDYRVWAPKVALGGILAIHDVFPNPEDGGRPPYEIFQFALSSRLFEEVTAVRSLRVLRRL